MDNNEILTLVSQLEAVNYEIGFSNAIQATGLIIDRKTSQRQKLRAAIEQRLEAFSNVMIGGNHLANALLTMDDPQAIADYDHALSKNGQPFADMWVAWKAIIELRDYYAGESSTDTDTAERVAETPEIPNPSPAPDTGALNTLTNNDFLADVLVKRIRAWGKCDLPATVMRCEMDQILRTIDNPKSFEGHYRAWLRTVAPRAQETGAVPDTGAAEWPKRDGHLRFTDVSPGEYGIDRVVMRDGNLYANISKKEAGATGAVHKKEGPYTLRRDDSGYAAAIERDGYTVLQLNPGTKRNEEEISGLLETLNKGGGARKRGAGRGGRKRRYRRHEALARGREMLK